MDKSKKKILETVNIFTKIDLHIPLMDTDWKKLLTCFAPSTITF